MSDIMDAQETGAGTACFLCSQSSFTWEKLDGQYRTKFHPDGPWLTLVSTARAIRARLCDGCGNILLFADVDRD